MKASEAIVMYLSLFGMYDEKPKQSRSLPARLQRTPDQVAELKRLAQEKRDRKAAKLKGE